jgi:hypothetical protein
LTGSLTSRFALKAKGQIVMSGTVPYREDVAQPKDGAQADLVDTEADEAASSEADETLLWSGDSPLAESTRITLRRTFEAILISEHTDAPPTVVSEQKERSRKGG